MKKAIIILMMFLMMPIVLSAEYLTPCTAGSRLTGNTAKDICGTGSFGVSGSWANITAVAPFTPNAGAYNSTSGGSTSQYISSDIVIQDTNPRCFMTWVKRWNDTSPNDVFGGHYWRVGWGFADDSQSVAYNGSLMAIWSTGAGLGNAMIEASPIVDNDWHAIIMQVNGSATSVSIKPLTLSIWLDGDLVINATHNSYHGSPNPLLLNQREASATEGGYNAYDHFVYYNGVCNSSMISEFSQLQPTDSLSVNWNGLSPGNGSTNNNDSLTYFYNFTAVPAGTIANCSFYWNGSVENTSYDLSPNTLYNFTKTITGNLNATILSKVSCTANNSLSADSSTKTIFWDYQIPYTVKGITRYSNGTLIYNATIVAVNQMTKQVVFNTSSNISGGWEYTIYTPGNYSIFAWLPWNSTILGPIKTFVGVS